MLSLKLKIDLPDEILPHLREYNKLNRCIFNLMKKKDIDKKEAVKWIEQKYNYNTEIIDKTILLDHIGTKAEMLLKSCKTREQDKVIFGSLKSWKDKHKGLISDEEFDIKRNLSGCLYTGKAGSKGNGKIKLDTTNQRLIFKPRRGIVIYIPYKTSKKRQLQLQRIQELGESKTMPYAVEINNSHVSILVDECKALKEFEQKNFTPNRIGAFDANPNLIGISVSDYDGQPEGEGKIIYREVINLYDLKKTHKSNKIKYELNVLAKRLAAKLRHLKVECFGYEKLTMSGSLGKGKSLNRLCNNDWKRNHFLNAFKKWLNIYNVQHKEIAAAYSSTIGCLQHPDETDSIAASLELSRRCYTFLNRFIKKNKLFANTNIIYPPFRRSELEERWNSILEQTKGKLGWISLHKQIKQMKLTSLRFLYQNYCFDNNSWISFRPNSGKALVLLHQS